MRLPARLPRAVLAAIVVVIPVVRTAPAGASNDPGFAQQWALEKVGAPQAWAVTTGAGIRIGIVDTGVDLAHPDLQGRIAASASCVNTNGNPAACGGSGQDAIGHGTHVAGIAAAIKDNGEGVAGVAPDATLLVAKVFSGDSAQLDDVTAGIKWVVDRGAKVVNLSLGEGNLLGLGSAAEAFRPGVEYAWQRGAIPVIAAGNSNFLGIFGSQNYGNLNAVVVGATGRNDEIASYSSPPGTAKWAIAAPGGNGADISQQILSTYKLPEKYGYLEGTSMAAPLVSGALADLLAAGVGQQKAVDLLLSTANKKVACGSNCAGRLDLAAAVAASGAGAGTVPPATTPTVTPATIPVTQAPRRTPRSTTTAAPPTETTPPTEPPPVVEETTIPETTIEPPVAETASAPPLTRASDDGPIGPAGAGAGLLLLAVAAWAGSVVLRTRRS